MPVVVEYPNTVKEARDESGSLFANEPERRRFTEYLAGFMIAQKKTVNLHWSAPKVKTVPGVNHA